MQYNGQQMSKDEYFSKIKNVAAKVIEKRFNRGSVVKVGDIVDGIMQRSEGVEDRHDVISVVYEEFRQFVNAQPKGTVCRG